MMIMIVTTSRMDTGALRRCAGSTVMNTRAPGGMAQAYTTRWLCRAPFTKRCQIAARGIP